MAFGLPPDVQDTKTPFSEATGPKFISIIIIDFFAV
jgi:hypothetical protein